MIRSKREEKQFVRTTSLQVEIDWLRIGHKRVKITMVVNARSGGISVLLGDPGDRS